MSRGPLPSRLHLLSNLPTIDVGAKVRFLGCVTGYSTPKAELCLAHRYPAGTDVVVAVDVQLLLETLTGEMTRIGEWVNVIGYITQGGEESDQGRVHVQAILVWAAGPVDVQRYERSFEGIEPG